MRDDATRDRRMTMRRMTTVVVERSAARGKPREGWMDGWMVTDARAMCVCVCVMMMDGGETRDGRG